MELALLTFVLKTFEAEIGIRECLHAEELRCLPVGLADRDHSKSYLTVMVGTRDGHSIKLS